MEYDAFGLGFDADVTRKRPPVDAGNFGFGGPVDFGGNESEPPPQPNSPSFLSRVGDYFAGGGGTGMAARGVADLLNIAEGGPTGWAARKTVDTVGDILQSDTYQDLNNAGARGTIDAMTAFAKYNPAALPLSPIFGARLDSNAEKLKKAYTRDTYTDEQRAADAEANAQSPLARLVQAEPGFNEEMAASRRRDMDLLSPEEMEAEAGGVESGLLQNPFADAVASFDAPVEIAQLQDPAAVAAREGEANAAPIDDFIRGRKVETAMNQEIANQAAQKEQETARMAAAAAPSTPEQEPLILTQAAPQPTAREKLLQSAGINYKANDANAAAAKSWEQDRAAKAQVWNELRAQELGGNVLDKVDALQRMAQLGDDAAAKRLEKFQNNPYLMRRYNDEVAKETVAFQRRDAALAREQQAAQSAAAQSEKAQEDERKNKAAKLAEEKFAFEKEQAGKAEANRKEDITRTEETRRQERMEALEKESRDLSGDLLKQSERLKGIEAIKDKQNQRMAAYHAANEVQRIAAQTTKNIIDRLGESQGITGRFKDWINGETAQGDIEYMLQAANRERADLSAKLDAAGTPVNIPQLDAKRVMGAVQQKKPKTFDDLKAVLSEVGTAGRAGIQYLTPAGRAATGFSEAFESFLPFGGGAAPAGARGGGGVPFAPFSPQDFNQ